jgi:hypothetical protein
MRLISEEATAVERHPFLKLIQKQDKPPIEIKNKQNPLFFA